MTYAYVVDVPAPIEMYDVTHDEIMKEPTSAGEGLLVHLARPTSTGFQIIEVWETKEQADRFNEEVVAPIVDRLTPRDAEAQPAPPRQEFEVRGLVIPKAQVFVQS